MFIKAQKSVINMIVTETKIKITSAKKRKPAFIRLVLSGEASNANV
jgi:hypothetical protein